MIKQTYKKYKAQGYDDIVAAKKTAAELEQNKTFILTGDDSNFHKVGVELYGETVWQQKLLSYALAS